MTKPAVPHPLLADLDDASLIDLVLRDPCGQPWHCAEPTVLAELVRAPGSLRRVAMRPSRELREALQLNPANARRVEALFLLARRLFDMRMPVGAQFLNPRQIFDHFHVRLRDHKKEVFSVVLLDARHRVMGEERISEGSLTSSIVHPREVFAPAVRDSAGAVVLVHNHPSGEPSPSEDDIAVTRRLERAAEILGIRILDHIIVGDGEYSSFKEMGLM